MRNSIEQKETFDIDLEQEARKIMMWVVKDVVAHYQNLPQKKWKLIYNKNWKSKREEFIQELASLQVKYSEKNIDSYFTIEKGKEYYWVSKEDRIALNLAYKKDWKRIPLTPDNFNNWKTFIYYTLLHEFFHTVEHSIWSLDKDNLDLYMQEFFSQSTDSQEVFDPSPTSFHFQSRLWLSKERIDILESLDGIDTRKQFLEKIKKIAWSELTPEQYWIIEWSMILFEYELIEEGIWEKWWVLAGAFLDKIKGAIWEKASSLLFNWTTRESKEFQESTQEYFVQHTLGIVLRESLQKLAYMYNTIQAWNKQYNALLGDWKNDLFTVFQKLSLQVENLYEESNTKLESKDFYWSYKSIVLLEKAFMDLYLLTPVEMRARLLTLKIFFKKEHNTEFPNKNGKKIIQKTWKFASSQEKLKKAWLRGDFLFFDFHQDLISWYGKKIVDVQILTKKTEWFW